MSKYIGKRIVPKHCGEWNRDIPYEMLAKELSKRMQDIRLADIHHLRSDSKYVDKLNSLMNAFDDIKFVLDEVNGED